jgi:2-keto-3-deoxy-6-phosphogluconate aldolase
MMDKQAVRERILHVGIVPVVRAASAAEARTAAEAVSKAAFLSSKSR